MKHFEKLKVHLCQLGIFYWDSSPKAKRVAMATRYALFFTSILSFTFAPSWYVVFEAQTSSDTTISIFFIFTSIFLHSWYLALIFQSEKYAATFEELDSIIKKS